MNKFQTIAGVERTYKKLLDLYLEELGRARIGHPLSCRNMQLCMDLINLIDYHRANDNTFETFNKNVNIYDALH